jgi:CheY-like chemotaxis protein
LKAHGASGNGALKKVAPKSLFFSTDFAQDEAKNLVMQAALPIVNADISSKVVENGSRNFLVSDNLLPFDAAKILNCQDELLSPPGRVDEEEKGDVLMPLQRGRASSSSNNMSLIPVQRSPAQVQRAASSSNSFGVSPLAHPDSMDNFLARPSVSSVMSNMRSILSRSFSSQKSNMGRSMRSFRSSGAHDSSIRHPGAASLASPLSRGTSLKRGQSKSRIGRSMTFLEELELRTRLLASMSAIGGSSGERLRYLVVDHSSENRKQAVKLIASQGQHVVAALDGLDCLRIVEDAKMTGQLFDVILIDDDNMPGIMSTKETCRILRSRGYVKILIIAMCDRVDPINARALFGVGFDAIIQRPLILKNLQEELKALIKRKSREGSPVPVMGTMDKNSAKNSARITAAGAAALANSNANI